jgi:MFS superfamily sulfate permease-like transporter
VAGARGARLAADNPDEMPQRLLAVLASLFVFGLALLAVYVAFVIRAVDCGADSDSECSGEGLTQIWVALVGLVPAALAVLGSIRGKGRPGVWFAATALVYGTWVLALLA